MSKLIHCDLVVLSQNKRRNFFHRNLFFQLQLAAFAIEHIIKIRVVGVIEKHSQEIAVPATVKRLLNEFIKVRPVCDQLGFLGRKALVKHAANVFLHIPERSVFIHDVNVRCITKRQTDGDWFFLGGLLRRLAIA